MLTRHALFATLSLSCATLLGACSNSNAGGPTDDAGPPPPVSEDAGSIDATVGAGDSGPGDSGPGVVDTDGCTHNPTCTQAGPVCVSPTTIETCAVDSTGCLFVSVSPSACTTNVDNAVGDCSANACGFTCKHGYVLFGGGCVREADGGVDGGTDSGVDAGTDGGADGGIDAGADSGVNAGIDSGDDGGVDGGND